MIILASASPRRQELLRQIGCDFCVVVSDVTEENCQTIPPSDLVVGNAVLKAQDVAAQRSADDIILGADTVVVMDGMVYGKPFDSKDAMRMLTALSGRTHEVYTGVALIKNGITYTSFERTGVSLAHLTAEEIQQYIDTGEPMDKAGAYAIQGKAAVFIEKINGCYTNVVGLPLYTLWKLSREAGFDLLWKKPMF